MKQPACGDRVQVYAHQREHQPDDEDDEKRSPGVRQLRAVHEEANRIRQRGYRDCPACARIDELKAIPPSVRTYAPGAGFAVTPGD